MSNNYFKFKQFTIEQEGCAMKVGTDGCLLGGWFNSADCKRVLDIGCGTGLIAIMAAQRSNAQITGVEIDATAAERARQNVANSPWSERIEIIHSDILSFESHEQFDAIVSNPPYFANSLKCDDNQRTLARHNDSLNSEAFFKKCASLLQKDGHISIIIPCDIMESWRLAAAGRQLHPTRITYIRTTPKKQPKRVLVEFSHNAVHCNESTLVLENSPGEYSEEAKKILRDFYLKIE